jgi:hypothetical protein
MYRMRKWSVRHARGLQAVYLAVERFLLHVKPLIERIGYARLDAPVLAFEKLTKGFLLDSQSCGQCVIAATGMSCPMNCPKSLRNGPCGGVRPDGKCEVDPDMDCVWVAAWEGNKRLATRDYPIQFVQPPVDNRLRGKSAWLHEIRLHDRRAAE